MVADGGVRTDAGADAARPKDASSGNDATTKPAEDSGGPVASDGGGGSGNDAPPGCDLSGKWFVNEHLGTNVLNAIQIANNWYYWEVTQKGSALTVAVSVGCGADVNGVRGIAAKADDSAAWDAYMTHKSYAGRTGTVTATDDGCDVKFDQASVVRGATVEAYTDPKTPLPKLADKATDTKPGWEDWDEDGKPGVTLRLSGLASGALYAVTRSWTVYQGPTSKDPTLLTLNMDWDQVRENLGSTDDPLGLLTLNATRDPDENLQIVELARLNEEQAAGDDAARCERLRNAAKTLTPNASKLE